MHKGGILFDLAKLISGSDAKRSAEVEQIVNELSVDRKLSHLIDDTLRNKLNLKRAGRIVGRGRTQIAGDVAKAVSLARDWLRILESKPGSARDLERRVADLRGDIETHTPDALEAISKMRERSPGPALSAALVCAHGLIKEVSTIFGHDRKTTYAVPAEPPTNVLTEDLVYVTDVDIGPDGNVAEGNTPSKILDLLVDTGSHAKTLDQAFDTRLRRGDLAGVQAALEVMARREHPREEACRDELDRKLSDQRPALARELDELSEKLEQAYTGSEATGGRARGGVRQVEGGNCPGAQSARGEVFGHRSCEMRFWIQGSDPKALQHRGRSSWRRDRALAPGHS